MTPSYIFGIDVSKAKLDIANEEGFSKKVANTESGIAVMTEHISKITNDDTSSIMIIIESTGSYHWLVCLELASKGFDVRLINPLITKKYQKSSIRDAKSDTVDALRLAEIGRLEKHLSHFIDAKETLVVKRYQSLLAQLQKTYQQVKTSYKAADEALSVIGTEVNLHCIEEALKSLEVSIKKLKSIIEESAPPIAQKLAETRGVSLFQAAVICNAVKGRTFRNKDQLTAFFGLDVRARQSGTWRGRSKLSKRGNPYCRKILYQLGWSLWRNNEFYAQYYQRLKSNGKHYYTILIAIARKFLHFFFKNFLRSYS